MRRPFIALASLLALVFVVAAPVQAEAPIGVEGSWSYFVYSIEVREDGCAASIRLQEVSVWTGSFDAVTYDVGQTGLTCSGLATYRGRNYFSDVTIDGKTGSFVMAVDGRQPLGDEWRGQWEIISASGELDGMQGAGTFWGPGAGGPFTWGHLDYEGVIVLPD